MGIILTLPPATAGYHYSLLETDWGTIGLAGYDTVLNRLILCASSPAKAEKAIKTDLPQARYEPDSFKHLQLQISGYFRGVLRDFSGEIDLSWASPFTRAVLIRCCNIPPGKTLSYGALANTIGRPRAARAVGNALAANRLPLIIPCHRVITSSHKLGGFSAPGGTSLKEKLLQHERYFQNDYPPATHI